jgi:hypothetical protein
LLSTDALLHESTLLYITAPPFLDILDAQTMVTKLQTQPDYFKPFHVSFDSKDHLYVVRLLETYTQLRLAIPTKLLRS